MNSTEAGRHAPGEQRPPPPPTTADPAAQHPPAAGSALAAAACGGLLAQSRRRRPGSSGRTACGECEKRIQKRGPLGRRGAATRAPRPAAGLPPTCRWPAHSPEPCAAAPVAGGSPPRRLCCLTCACEAYRHHSAAARPGSGGATAQGRRACGRRRRRHLPAPRRPPRAAPVSPASAAGAGRPPGRLVCVARGEANESMADGVWRASSRRRAGRRRRNNPAGRPAESPGSLTQRGLAGPGGGGIVQCAARQQAVWGAHSESGTATAGYADSWRSRMTMPDASWHC